MRIDAARLNGFRNLSDTTLSFSPRVNLILGRNGEGKTNLLEALNYFALGRSHRGARNTDLVAFGQDALHVELDVTEDTGSAMTCEYGLGRDGGRRFRLDGEAVRRRGDLVGRLATVFFNPDSIRLVRGAPERRRQFVDQGMAEIDAAHLVHLTAFHRALKQKTGLLRDFRQRGGSPTSIKDDLTAWNREIARHAAPVVRGRADYAALLTPSADQAHRDLTGTSEKLAVTYRPHLESVLPHLSPETLENAEKTPKNTDMEQDIFEEIDYITGLEIQRGRPLTGPQLDDFEVRLGGADGWDLRTYGSQGETRSAAISMILARSDALFRRRQVRPVLFLDDIFSELDRDRTRRLQEMTTELHQVFIATARPDDIADWRPGGMRAWRVEDGTFTTSEDPSAPL